METTCTHCGAELLMGLCPNPYCEDTTADERDYSMDDEQSRSIYWLGLDVRVARSMFCTSSVEQY